VIQIHICEDTFKTGLGETGCAYVNSTQLVQWREFVVTTKYWAPYNGTSLTRECLWIAH